MTEVTIWANLSHAYKKGQPIDWAALEKAFPRAMLTCHKGQDCCKVKGRLRTSGAKTSPLADIDGWVLSGPTEFGLSDLMHDGWDSSGWVLWVEGEIPLRPLTAADLPLGTCFQSEGGFAYVVVESPVGTKLAAEYAPTAVRLAEYTRVKEAYGVGTFKKAEAEA